MKKLLAMLLCLSMLLCFAACGDEGANGDEQSLGEKIENKIANETFEEGLQAFADVSFLGKSASLEDMVPAGIWEYFFDYRSGEVDLSDCKYWLDSNKDRWLEPTEDYGVGTIEEVTVEVVSVDPWDENSVKNFKQWEEMYGVEMTDGYTIEAKFTYKGTDGEKTEELSQQMFKSGDKYYVWTAVANADTLVANAYFSK